jgi:hypothetical protein
VKGTLSVFEAVGDSLGDEELLDFVTTGRLEFENELALSLDDLGVFPVPHQFEMDSGFGACHLELSLVDDRDFLFLLLCVAHSFCYRNYFCN